MPDDVRDPPPRSPADDTDGYRATVIQLERPSTRPAPSEAGTPDAASTASSEDRSEDRSAGRAVVLVDDRLLRRRIAVRREAGHRRLRRLLWVLLPVALLVDGAVVAHLPMFDVDRISIEGAERTPSATVAWAAGIKPGDTLATVDEQGAERRIERLPWVAGADVIRQWPSTVRIVITERQPAAAVYSGQGFPAALVDRDARVLDIGGEIPFGVMTLTGLEGGLDEGGLLPSSMVPALDLAVALNERLPGAVAAVDVDLDATLSSGGIVRFGSTDELEEKLVALDALLSDVDLSGLAVLDLRVPSSPALRRE